MENRVAKAALFLAVKSKWRYWTINSQWLKGLPLFTLVIGVEFSLSVH